MPALCSSPSRITISRLGSRDDARRPGGQCASSGPAPQHGEVVAALERTGTDEGPTAHVVDGKGQLVAAVGGIDADHDGPDAGRGKLHQAPLYVVRRPDADPIPGRIPSASRPSANLSIWVRYSR